MVALNYNEIMPMALPVEILSAELDLLAENYGIELSEKEISVLTKTAEHALSENGLVEFGEPVIKKLMRAFAPSEYIPKEQFSSVLAELLEIYYYFRGETEMLISDYTLIDYMAKSFEEHRGSLEYLAGTAMEKLTAELKGIAYE